MNQEFNELSTMNEYQNANRGSSTDKDYAPRSPAKAGRRYELQRKIDEELRRLQLADGMEQGDEKYNDKNLDPVSAFEEDGGLLSQENGQIPDLRVINDDESGAEIEPPVKHSDFLKESVPRTAIQSAAADEIDTSVDSKHDDSVAMKPAEVDLPECSQRDGINKLDSSSEEVESDQVAPSSTMTSPTTTTGTFTLPLHSPETEEDLTEELLPVDQVSSTFRDPLGRVGSSPSPVGLDVSEISSEVFLAQENSWTKMSQPNRAADNVGRNIDRDNNDVKPSIAIEPATKPPETPLIVENEKMKSCEYFMPKNTESTEMKTDIPPVIAGDTPDFADDEPNKDIEAKDEKGEDLNELGEESDAEDVLDEEEFAFIGARLQTSHPPSDPPENQTSYEVGSVHEFCEVTLTASDNPTPELMQIISNTPEDKCDSQNVVESGSDRKISTDDEEYSGYDIDMGDPSSCQEEYSIAEEDYQSEDNTEVGEIHMTQACDGENVPLFADVKYSIGEQITNLRSHDDMSYNEEATPTEEKSPDFPEIVPWDSNGLEQPEKDFAECPPLPSDRAEGDGISSRSSDSQNENNSKEEITAKIAEETVSTAIKAAFEIALGSPTEIGDQPSNPVSENSPSESDNVPDTPTGERDYTGNSVENVAPDNAGAVFKIEGESADDSSRSVSDAARESDVAHTDGEKVPAVEATEAASKGNENIAAVGLENSATDASLAGGRRQEELIIAKIESQPQAEYTLPKVSGKVEDFKPVDSNHTNETDREVVSNEGTEEDQDSQELVETGEKDMVKVNDSPENERNLPERITYSPALSQRNTEATKWFGQPTAENKIWMKPSGKVDECAEQERRKLIKAMTRRHNPNLVSKWQPPKEKDFSENLDEKQKASLKKYEERRRSRSDAAFRDDGGMVQPNSSSAPVESTDPHACPKENIVIESVVHSRAAIDVWESRLSEKQRKEELERQRLSFGKQKNRNCERAATDVCRTRYDSSSSISSTTSEVLPTSEHIERESVDISRVRNRWRNIEEESNKVKAMTKVKKETPIRRSTFSVNAGPTYRSYQTPTSVKPVNVTPVNITHGGPVVRTAREKESFIDREIREAAEREEKWKQEQWDKTSEVSAASSEEVFSDNLPTPSNDPKVIATVYTRSLPPEDVVGLDILKDADREECWKSERSASKVDPIAERQRSKDSSGFGSDPVSPPPQFHTQRRVEMDLESLSSYSSSEAANGLSSPPSLTTIAQEKVAHEVKTSRPAVTRQLHESTDSGVECGSSVTPVKISEKEPTTAKYVSPVKTEEEDDSIRRKRIASLTSVVAPRGWEPAKNRAIGLPTVPLVRSVAKPEVKSPTSPRIDSVSALRVVKIEAPKVSSPTSPSIDVASETPAVKNGTAKTTFPPHGKMQSAEEMEYTNHPPNPVGEGQISTKVIPPTTKSVPPKAASVQKKSGPVFNKKGPVEVSSSKSRLHAVMEKEMQDAAVREEEWRKKQIEQVKQGFDLSPHPIVHSTREIRTPGSTATSPPVNADEQAPQRRIIKSLFADDDPATEAHIRDDASDEYKKRAVVKAMRVPKRKSQLAMRWEEGQFENNGLDGNE